MKKLLFILLILLLTATTVIAEDFPTEEIMTEIGMSQAQIKHVLNMQLEIQLSMQMANAELGILRAQLTKELINPNPDMGKIEEIIGNTLEYRIQNEMGSIQLRVRTRELVGEANWREMLLARKRSTQTTKPSSNPEPLPDPTPTPPATATPKPDPTPDPPANTAPTPGPGPGSN